MVPLWPPGPYWPTFAKHSGEILWGGYVGEGHRDDISAIDMRAGPRQSEAPHPLHCPCNGPSAHSYSGSRLQG